ncbi:MAG: dipeptide epimerase [Bacteroidetes bacterium]|nr:dipeptide epimerase [Bacteroidota bacterium]
MKISYAKYSLELKHQFTISFSTRKFTPIVIIRLEQDGIFGYGEASLPPYLPEDQESVVRFLSKVELHDLKNYDDLIDNLENINKISPADQTRLALGDPRRTAKASVDIALHDLLGKIQNRSCSKIYNLHFAQLPLTSFTIGIDNEDVIKQKVSEADEFKILKIKLGTDNDKQIINMIRQLTDKPLYVDANQGWDKKEKALEMIEWLSKQNVVLVEQPMPKTNFSDTKWLTANSPLPVIADESFQRLDDLERVKETFSGINVKLMKCTGIREAYKIIMKAKECDLKIMLGCMTETSCGISAAIQLASLADFADLDGNQLIKNDPFATQTVQDGRLIASTRPGLGVNLTSAIEFIEL